MTVQSHKLKKVESEIWPRLLFNGCLNSSYSILKLQDYVFDVKNLSRDSYCSELKELCYLKHIGRYDIRSPPRWLSLYRRNLRLKVN